MNKKRKVCSPSQREQRDSCAELKEFITRENARCVKEIQDSNDRRIGALDESLSFAMDSLTAVSERQHSADIFFLHKFSPNLLNGRIDEDRARNKQSLLRRPWPLPSDRDIPGNRQNLEAKV